MKLCSFRYIFPQAFKSMCRNGWMTIAAILTIAISLFLCAAFWLFTLNLDANVANVEDEIRVVAYLDPAISTQADREKLEKELSYINGVEKIDFVSKDDGLKSLEARFGGVDLAQTLGGSNPLPDAFSLTATDSEQIPEIAAACEKIAGVSQVRYGAGTVEKLTALANTLHIVGLAVMLLLGLAALTLIALAIRLTIVSRRREVMVMKWVGATNAFIRWPFFLEGLILGLLGAAIALALVILTYNTATQYVLDTVSFIRVLALKEILLPVAELCLGAGLFLGALGSLLPLSRFLHV